MQEMLTYVLYLGVMLYIRITSLPKGTFQRERPIFSYCLYASPSPSSLIIIIINYVALKQMLDSWLRQACNDGLPYLQADGLGPFLFL